MKIRFLANADLNKAIVNGVLRREPSIDFLTAQSAGLRALNDPEVLKLASEQQRVLVSHDVGTMPAHFHAFREAENQRWRIPDSPEPRYRSCHRRTSANLAGVRSIGVG